MTFAMTKGQSWPVGALPPRATGWGREGVHMCLCKWESLLSGVASAMVDRGWQRSKQRRKIGWANNTDQQGTWGPQLPRQRE